MTIKTLGSSSNGNCYIVGNDTECILIECGLKIDEIKNGLDFDLNKVKACITSHEHLDHSKAIKQVSQYGIPVYCSIGTAEACGLSPDEYELIYHGGTRKVGDWTIRAFEVEHDAAEPLGFIIEHQLIGRILFVTDTYILKHDFSNWHFDVLMIEANYCEDIARDKREKYGQEFIEKRRLRSHMSFQTAMRTIQKMHASSIKDIILLHLSDGLSNEVGFQVQCQKQFGIKTTIAAPGVEVKLNEY